MPITRTLRQAFYSAGAALTLAACAAGTSTPPSATTAGPGGEAGSQPAGLGSDGVHGTHGTGAIPYVTGTGSHSYTLRADTADASLTAFDLPFYYIASDRAAGGFQAAPGDYQPYPDPPSGNATAFTRSGVGVSYGINAFPGGFYRPGFRSVVPVLTVSPGVPLEYNPGVVDSPTGRLVFGSHNLADQGIRGGGFDAHLPPPQLNLGFGVIHRPLFGY